MIKKKKITERLETSCDVFPISLKKVHFLKTKNVNILYKYTLILKNKILEISYE